jgi:hypothetical protein
MLRPLQPLEVYVERGLAAPRFQVVGHRRRSTTSVNGDKDLSAQFMRRVKMAYDYYAIFVCLPSTVDDIIHVEL